MLAAVALIGVGTTWTLFKLCHSSRSASNDDGKLVGAFALGAP